MNVERIKRIRTIIRMVMAVFGLSFTAWMFISMQARNVDAALFESDETVYVEKTDAYITFKPAVDTLGIGLLFYPGALVDPDAYVPLVRELAETGYEAIIVKVPFRLDVQGWQKEKVFANTLARLEQEDKDWVLAGHSRGARRALEFVNQYEDQLAGLILVGTSHPRENDHSGMRIPVAKVYASNDGLASQAEVEQYRSNLPGHTKWVLIEGGNHAQFGWYGRQFGDDKATISREEQQEKLLEAVLSFMAF